VLSAFWKKLNPLELYDYDFDGVFPDESVGEVPPRDGAGGAAGEYAAFVPGAGGGWGGHFDGGVGWIRGRWY
jgi:hypothetical protein